MNSICNLFTQFLSGCNLSSLFSGMFGNGGCGFGGFFGGNCN